MLRPSVQLAKLLFSEIMAWQAISAKSVAISVMPAMSNCRAHRDNAVGGGWRGRYSSAAAPGHFFDEAFGVRRGMSLRVNGL